MTENKLIVISGCSGGGKSTLLTEFANQGYAVMPEVGREIVKEQLVLGTNVLPWKDSISFCKLLVAKSIHRYYQATNLTSVKDDVVFFDRSYIEGISYSQKLNLPEENNFDYLVQKSRYYPLVFMAPPWKEIFQVDRERKNSFEDSVEEYERLLKDYSRYGYELVILPKVSVLERYKFIHDKIASSN